MGPSVRDLNEQSVVFINSDQKTGVQVFKFVTHTNPRLCV